MSVRFTPPVADPDNRLESAARVFHYNNPHVFELAEQLAAQALSRTDAIGIGAIWERMRWHFRFDTIEVAIDPSTDKPLKLNNNYRAYYARWMLSRHPDWTGRIRIRELRAFA